MTILLLFCAIMQYKNITSKMFYTHLENSLTQHIVYVQLHCTLEQICYYYYYILVVLLL